MGGDTGFTRAVLKDGGFTANQVEPRWCAAQRFDYTRHCPCSLWFRDGVNPRLHPCWILTQGYTGQPAEPKRQTFLNRNLDNSSRIPLAAGARPAPPSLTAGMHSTYLQKTIPHSVGSGYSGILTVGPIMFKRCSNKSFL